MTETPNETKPDETSEVLTPAILPQHSGVQLQKRASLAEKAVQAVAKGEVKIEHRKPRRKYKKRKHTLDRHVVAVPLLAEYIEETLTSTENGYTKVELIDSEHAILR